MPDGRDIDEVEMETIEARWPVTFWIWLNDRVAKPLKWNWLKQFCYHREGHYWDTHDIEGNRI